MFLFCFLTTHSIFSMPFLIFQSIFPLKIHFKAFKSSQSSSHGTPQQKIYWFKLFSHTQCHKKLKKLFNSSFHIHSNEKEKNIDTMSCFVYGTNIKVCEWWAEKICSKAKKSSKSEHMRSHRYSTDNLRHLTMSQQSNLQFHAQ